VFLARLLITYGPAAPDLLRQMATNWNGWNRNGWAEICSQLAGQRHFVL